MAESMTEWLAMQPVPSPDEQKAACAAILASGPDILLFKHYWWLTGIPVPPRKNLQTNEAYARQHYWRLKRAATERLKSLDNPIQS